MFDKIIETNNKKVSIQITNKGEVILKKPKRYKKELLDKFIESKQKWIEDHKAKILKNLEKNEQIIQGESILIFGQKKELKVGSKTNEIGENEVLCKTQKSLITLIKKFALEKITEKCKFWANKMGVEPVGYAVENTRRRWGACTSKKQIKINFRAVMLDEKCFNYILIHELAHLKEFNHSTKFWNIVKKYEPNYIKYRKQLKDYGFLLEMYR